jgi:hypothetical protein
MSFIQLGIAAKQSWKWSLWPETDLAGLVEMKMLQGVKIIDPGNLVGDVCSLGSFGLPPESGRQKSGRRALARSAFQGAG